MFIQTEVTPNPSTLKFIPGGVVMEHGAADFRDPAAAARSPMAQALFAIEGIEGVFLGSDFISVTKAPAAAWFSLKPAVLAAILDHFTAGLPIIETDNEAAAASEDDEIVVQIKEILDTRVRPAVAQDGGDIVFHDFEDGIVYLEMHGSCSGCPSSTATLKAGIENMLRYYVPEVREVRAVA